MGLGVTTYAGLGPRFVATITIWWDFGPLANPGFYEGDSFKVQVIAYCLSNADGVKGVVSASPERFIRFFGAKHTFSCLLKYMILISVRMSLTSFILLTLA